MRSKSHSCLILALVSLVLPSSGHFLDAAGPAKPFGGPMLQKFLAGPMAGIDEIVFAARVSGHDHWYVNFGYYCDAPNTPGYGKGGQLCRLNLRTGQLKVLLEDKDGGIRDPQVHYDAQKILFSYRKGKGETFHLYEINIDGTGLKQLTDGPDDDIEPAYLPDGGIVFCSSRCKRVVNCWYTRVAVLYRCDGDGKNVRMISSNNDHDNTPCVLPDGRILYMRWEYVDRSQVHFHHLWTVNPDGTAQMVYFGNEFAGTSMLDPQPIPGTNKAVSSFSPGHGRPEHMGHVTIVDPGSGPDILPSARQVSNGKILYRDPWAFSEDCFLVANADGIMVMDGKGNTEMVLARQGKSLELHEPRPLMRRQREANIADRTDLRYDKGWLVLANIYQGRKMEGIRPGEIKKLLVLEQLPKPVNFSGGQEPLSIGGTFTLARALGIVPVEPDGSAFMELPALRSLFFVALDENDLSVRRMQSFVTLQPGEKSGCVGCHEQRSQTPKISPNLLAACRPASKIQPLAGLPQVPDFPRDIQPILDKHCVQCHNPDKWEGRVDLSSDKTPVFTRSYWNMIQHGLIADGRNTPYGNRGPRQIGSAASKILTMLDGSHHDVKLSDRDRRMFWLWIETGATYPGTYAALGSGMYPVDLPLATLQRRCGQCHDAREITRPHKSYTDYHVQFGLKGRGVPSYLSSASWQMPLLPQSWCNLSRPEKSLMLRAPLAKKAGGLELCKGAVFSDTADKDYQELLKIISAAAADLKTDKRFDMAGFRPNEHYIREMQRFGALPENLKDDDPVNVYATDDAYWRSFWYRPPHLR